MAVEDLLIAYKSQVNTGVAQQTNANTIDPYAVANIGINLADILIGELPKQNRFGITASNADPSGGSDTDLHFKSLLNSVEIYRNIEGVWTLLATIPISISYPDGILVGLLTNIFNDIVTIFPGAWAISNSRYAKVTQTQFTVPAADANWDRYDLIYADNTNAIGYTNGVASSVPAFPDPAAGQIVVDYVVVPSVASGTMPYLLSGGSNNGQIPPVTGTFDSNNEYDLSAIVLPPYPNVSVYVNGKLAPIEYDNTNKKLTGGNVGDSFIARFGT